MEAEQVVPVNLEELQGDLQDMQASQNQLWETLAEQMQNDKGLFGRVKKTAACQTLKTQLDVKDGHSQTDSIKNIIEDFQDD